MDAEEVFSCSLQESYYGDNDYTFIKPPLLSHTPDYDQTESTHSDQEDLIGTPLLYAIEPLSIPEDDMFSLDQDQDDNHHVIALEQLAKPRLDTILIPDSADRDHVDAGFSTVPQDNYRIWLEKF